MNIGHLLSNQDLFNWLETLTGDFNVFGPILKKRGQTVFERIDEAKSLHLDYCSTMTAPRKFIYPPEQKLFKIDRDKNQIQTLITDDERNNIIFGIHPCDMHAIFVLDKVFLGEYKDLHYSKLRQETITVVLNCNKACDKGFCASMRTGPFLKIAQDYDLQLTSMGEYYLVESGSERGRGLIEKVKNLKEATKQDFEDKIRQEEEAIDSFTKGIDTEGLAELLMRSLDHHIYKDIAEVRCLGCTNCTMVCPTCYCYNIEDHTSLDLKTTERRRHWDSCQELNFAGVHGGNFRSSRGARLRQFVTHKLSAWVEQYGCFGCVGCGRCMAWCPTGIDLTEIAKKIQEDYKKGRSV